MSDRLDELAKDDEFFVGYLPTPPRTKRFALAVGVALVIFVAGLQAALAAFQRGPGDTLERSRRAELDGVFVQEPYPMIRYLTEEGEVQTALFSRGWKAGLGTRFAELDGQGVHVTGRLFTRRDARGPRELFVLNGSPEPTELDAEVQAKLAVEEESLGEVTLQGTIIDSKCMYGQMRPGDGRAHRACAQLCIAGGIPPAFVTKDAEGAETHYVLADAEGGNAIPRVLEFVAEPTRAVGTLVRRGDLVVLRLASITALEH
ncbi:MAG: hypothetical protein AAGH15_15210 [Myxococcota bacterium]